MSVWVVDNGSRDGTPEFVRHAFPGVRVFGLSENRGFSAANNVALRETRSDHILLLNPDTEIWPEVLDQMVAFLCEHPRAAIAGCRLVRRDGSFDHAAKRSFPTVSSALRYFRPGSGRSGYLAPDTPEEGVGPVDAVNGAFALVRKTAMDEVGLLDEGYWLYAEDLDWCYRFKQAGWEVLYNGRVTTLHLKGAIAGTPRRLRHNWAFHSSMGRFYRKHYSGGSARLDGLVYAGVVAKCKWVGQCACRGSDRHRAASRRQLAQAHGATASSRPGLLHRSTAAGRWSGPRSSWRLCEPSIPAALTGRDCVPGAPVWADDDEAWEEFDTSGPSSKFVSTCRLQVVAGRS